MLFTKEEVAALSNGKGDDELDSLGRAHGFLQLACDAEGIDVKRGLKTTDFSRSNPFAHRAWRHGAIEVQRRTREITREEAKGGVGVHDDGSAAQVTEVVFKGE